MLSETRPAVSAARIVEDIVGCKWSLAVLGCIRSGTTRPGAIRRSLPGLSTKVMNERLAKMLRFGLVERRSYAESRPRVEYSLTPAGVRLAAILDDIQALQADIEGTAAARTP
jgi:DNA-binding HxlR family transcriptional regulator